MTPDRRNEIMLESIAARLELLMADAELKQAEVYMRTGGRISPGTVGRVLRARNHTLCTLVDIADALGCDLEINFRKRDAA